MCFDTLCRGFAGSLFEKQQLFSMVNGIFLLIGLLGFNSLSTSAFAVVGTRELN